MPTKSRTPKTNKSRTPKTRRAGAAKKPGPKLPKEARAAYTEVQKGVQHLERSIAEIRKGVGRAEQRIESDARRRARELRREASGQLKVLEERRRAARRKLQELSVAAGESWRDVRRTADSILADARATAAAIGKRFRGVLGT